MVKIWPFILFSMTCAFAQLVDYSDSASSKNKVKNMIFKVPKRHISIIVTPEGFYPKSISVFEGERVRFFVTSTMDTPSCFMLNEKELFLSASKGRVTEGEVYFANAGDFEFHCPSSKNKGFLTVIGRRKIRRKVANEAQAPKVWMPKD